MLGSAAAGQAGAELIRIDGSGNAHTERVFAGRPEVIETPDPVAPPSPFAWPASRPQRLLVGLIAALIAVLFGVTTALNWAEDRFLTPAEGSLLLDRQTGKVYRLAGGQKRHITNIATMRCLRRPGQHFIRYRALDDLPTGPPIENREGCQELPEAGTLLRPVGQPDVYISTGVSLRPIPDARTLECLRGIREIESAAPSYVQMMPIGPPVPDGEGCR